MTALLVWLLLVQAPAPAGATLRIVIVDGEDAINIVQQKTAVRPLVEVRDRNNLPVPGATVTFTIGSGQPATFAGAQTVTVTTNAAGQAAATGLTPTGAGKVSIQVHAAHQGQVASAAITQTNFVTAAAAAAAGAAVGTASAAGGASTAAGTGAGAATGAGGGGISATTIALVGAAVGGGAVVAQQTGLVGGGKNEDSFDVYRGSLSGAFVFTNTCTGGPVSPSTCTFNRAMTATLTIELRSDLSGGRALVEGSQTDQSVSGTAGCSLNTNPITFTTPDTNATGGPSALTFTSIRGEPSQRTTVTFTGSHSGTSITGSLTVEMTSQTTATTPAATSTCSGRGSATVPVTLQRSSGGP